MNSLFLAILLVRLDVRRSNDVGREERMWEDPTCFFSATLSSRKHLCNLIPFGNFEDQ